MPAETLVIEARDVTRRHVAGGVAVLALDRVSLEVARGEVVAVIGPSGSGKSTLLYLLAGLDRPDAGEIRVAGTSWSTLNATERARFRRRTCGFVVQGMALLPQATAAENVDVPLVLDDIDAAERAVRVIEALERVGLVEEADKLPDQLSGGQKQRVGIARCLAHHPRVILADEPTGELDSNTSAEVMTVLLDSAAALAATLVLVTHDIKVANRCERVVFLRDGLLVADEAAQSRALSHA
jgi:ABC-type lipoprotein export system ATPase subunit